MHRHQSISDLTRLCIHTQTHRPWDLKTCIREFSHSGVNAISIWRHLIEGQDITEIRRLLKDTDMEVVSLVRGGFFASKEPEIRRKAIGDNLRAIGEAESIGTGMIVLVCGADPRQSLEDSRNQIMEGIAQILPRAAEAGIRMAVEPLHPMYAADRSAINTLAEANDMAEALQSDWVGVAVDVYHVWWDPQLEEQIRRCGRMGKLFGFHVCDWKVETADLWSDRGLMGEGCIPLKQIRSWMEQSGFDGYHEVEIFSERYWSMDQQDYLERIMDAYLAHT